MKIPKSKRGLTKTELDERKFEDASMGRDSDALRSEQDLRREIEVEDPMGYYEHWGSDV